VGVRSADEVRLAVESVQKPRPEGLQAMLEPFLDAVEDEAQWEAMLTDADDRLREAAQRRQHDLSRV
jgi:hypothetical protein